MKICVYGAGAVGGHIAGRLAAGGAEVSLIARGEQLAAIREHGLRVETRTAAADLSPVRHRPTRRPGPQDIVIVAVKAPSLPAIAEHIASLLHQDSLALFVMNGIPWWYFHSHGGPLDGTQLRRLDPDADPLEPHRPGTRRRRGRLYRLQCARTRGDPCRKPAQPPDHRTP